MGGGLEAVEDAAGGQGEGAGADGGDAGAGGVGVADQVEDVAGDVVARVGQAGDDDLTLTVAGNDGQLTVTALFDNLGKGASGAAVQNMNLMLGFEETEGLSLS